MEKLKGLTIGLDLDTIKVDSGLRDLKSSMRLVNSELRSGLSAFNYSERSLKKYGVQLDGLNKKLELQKIVTDSARKHYEKMVDAHGEGSKQAEDAAASFNHESAELNNLERRIQRVTTEMKTFERQQVIQNSVLYKSGDALVKFGSKLDELSSKAKTVGGTLTKYLTTPIAGLAATVGGMGFKRSMDLEQVEFMMEHISDSAGEFEKRMSTVVGLVTDTRFGTAEIGNEFAKLIGAGAVDESAKKFNEVAMNLATFKSDDSLISRFGDMFTSALQAGSIDGTMINQFASAGVDVLKTLGNVWGKSTEDVRKILRSGDKDIQTVLNDLSNGILDGTEGVNGATKAMGGMLEGSGKLLSGQIKNFFAAISQTGERLIKETGLFDGVKNALDELRNMLKSGELDSVLIPTFQGLSKAMEALVDLARKIFKWFSSLDDSTKEWIGKLVGLGVVLGPIITGLGIFGGIIAKAATGLGDFLKFIAPITAKFKGIEKVAAEGGKKVGLLSRAFTLLTGPVGWVVTGIVALGGAIVAAYKKSDPFRNALGETVELFKSIWSNIKNGLSSINLFEGKSIDLKNVLDSLLGGLRAVGDFLAKVFGGILTLTVKRINFFLNIIKILSENISTFVSAWKKVFFGDFKGAAELFATGIKDMFFGIVDFLAGIISPIRDKAMEIGKAIVFSIVDWVSTLSDRLRAYFVDLAVNIGRHIIDVKNKISERLLEITATFIAWIKELPSKLVDLKDAFVTRLGEILETIGENSRKFGNAFVEGLKNLPGDIKKALIKAKDAFNEWIEEQHELNKEFYSNLGDNISNWISNKKDSIIQGFSEWKKSITQWFSEMPSVIGDNASDWWKAVKKNFLDKKDDFKNGFTEWKKAIEDWFKETTKLFKKRFEDWKKRTIKFFTEMPGVIKDRTTEWFNSLKQGFLDRKDEIVESFNAWKDGIVGWFKEMPGTIRERAGDFATGFKDGIVAKKNEIVEGFNNWWDGIKDWFSGIGKKEEIKETGKTIVKNIKKGAEEQKDDLMSRIGSIILDIPKYILMVAAVLFLAVGRELIKRITTGMENAKGQLTGLVDRIRETIEKTFNNMVNGIKVLIEELRKWLSQKFENIRSTIVNLATRTRDGIIGKWNEIKNSVSTLASNMWTSVSTTFNDMVNGAKKLPGRIGDGIKEAASKATSAVKDMGNNMLSALEKPINGMIGGINWVTGKLIPDRVPIKDVALPRFAKGTGKDGHKGGPAIVGEEGRELIKLPDGRSFVSPGQDTLLNLPKGTHVIPNPQTEMLLKSDIPHFAKGTGFFDSIKNIGSKIKSGVKKAWDTIGDVWSYATNPSKLVTKLLSGLGIDGVSGFAKDLGSAAWSYVKSKPLEYIKGLFKDADDGGGKPAFGWPMTSPFGYRIHPITKKPKLHAGVDFGAPSGSPIPSTTGGTVSHAGWLGGFGNLVKVKQGIWEMFYAHMSKVMVKAGQSVKKGDILGLVGSTGDSTGPHLHYETRKNGVPVNPMTLKGFKTGGIIKSKMMAMLGEEGEEMVIPLAKNRRTDAMKLLALTAKKLGANNGSFTRPSGISSSGNDDFKELLKEVVEQNEYLQQMVDLLMQLLDKDFDAVLAFEPVYSAIKKRMNEDRHSNHKSRRGR